MLRKEIFKFLWKQLHFNGETTKCGSWLWSCVVSKSQLLFNVLKGDQTSIITWNFHSISFTLNEKSPKFLRNDIQWFLCRKLSMPGSLQHSRPRYTFLPFHHWSLKSLHHTGNSTLTVGHRKIRRFDLLVSVLEHRGT